MKDFAKRKVGGDLPSEEQPCSKKSSVVRPFSKGASSFRPWQPSNCKKDLGIAEASNSTTEPILQLQLAISNNNNNAAQDNNGMNIDNSTAENNPIIDGGGTISGVGSNNAKASQTDEIQDMNPKLKRMLLNRAYEQKSRRKKNEYIAGLEGKAKSYENKIATLHPQIEAYKNHIHFLLIEQHNLKLQMVTREKDRILKEAEIEKNQAKVNRLSELRSKQLMEARARMLNVDDAMQLMSNSNSNSSNFGRLIFSNSDQGQNAVDTSRSQTAKGQQLQNQSQKWIAKWGNGQKAAPNLNIVKSEPMDQ